MFYSASVPKYVKSFLENPKDLKIHIEYLSANLHLKTITNSRIAYRTLVATNQTPVLFLTTARATNSTTSGVNFVINTTITTTTTTTTTITTTGFTTNSIINSIDSTTNSTATTIKLNYTLFTVIATSSILAMTSA